MTAKKSRDVEPNRILEESGAMTSLLHELIGANPHHPRVLLEKLEQPNLAWVNIQAMQQDPLFASVGHDERKYREALLDRCAYVLPTPEVKTIPNRTAVGVVDRYGGAGIGQNGGSGRALYLNGYHIKGVGRTPLISSRTDEAHASGGAYLEEAVREAIFASLVELEFPHGSIPILAIIVTGQTTTWIEDEGPRPERRCLVVRPAFGRPAHYEKASSFISNIPHDGAADYMRSRMALVNSIARLGEQGLLEMFREFFSKWGEQLAFSYIHRMPHGGNTSSNISLDARLLDFGGMTAVPGWSQYSTMLGCPPSGRELAFVVSTAESLIANYAQAISLEPEQKVSLTADLVAKAAGTYASTAYFQALALCGLGKYEIYAIQNIDGVQINREIDRILSQAQAEKICIFDTMSPPKFSGGFDVVWTDSSSIFATPLRVRLTSALAVINGGAPVSEENLLRIKSRASYICRPRFGLYREQIKKNIYRAVENDLKGDRLSQESLDQLIGKYIVENARYSHSARS